MGTPLDPSVPDLLMGLAPAAPSCCPRCGSATRALANGRGRLDICGRCGTVDVHTAEGLDLLTLRAPGAADVDRLRSALRDPGLSRPARAPSA